MGLFDRTSTTRVLFLALSMPLSSATARATAPPARGSSVEQMAGGTHDDPEPKPRPSRDEEELAAPPATSSMVAPTPTAGRQGRRKRCAVAGRPLPKARPTSRGTRTREAVERSTEIPSMATVVPSRADVSTGVITTPSTVVDRVHTTEREMSPPARRANRFEACPPPTHPRRTVPATRSGPTWAPKPRQRIIGPDDSPSARRGMRIKQQTTFQNTTDCDERSVSAALTSDGVAVIPMASMRIESERETDRRDPNNRCTRIGCVIPMPAARRVQRGAPRVIQRRRARMGSTDDAAELDSDDALNNGEARLSFATAFNGVDLYCAQ